MDASTAERSNSPMEIEYTMTEDDLIAFNNYTIEQRFGGRRTLDILAIVAAFPVLTTAIAVADALAGKPLSLPMVIPGVIGTLFSFSIVFRHRLIALAVQRQLGQPSAANLLAPQQVVIRPESVSVYSTAQSGTVQWSAVERIGVTDSYIFIRLTPNEALVVPKHAFPEESAFETFAETVMGNYEAATTPAND
jgi:YcxB-like protein